MTCIVSVAFGQKYIEQIERLERSIAGIEDTIIWKDIVPGRPFLESLYGFKVHAVREAVNRGYKKIIWLDPACIVVGDTNKLFGIKPVLAVKDSSLLKDTISDKALEYYGNPDITGWHLVGGSLYVFDFGDSLCEKIFSHWEKAEHNGIFGSQDEASSGRINKHRNDESCMAMAMYMNGCEPVSEDICGYGTDTVIKKHFR